MSANHLQTTILTVALLFTFLSCNVKKATVPEAKDYLLHESKADHDQRMAWWRDARFGMFIHWGLYAVPAGEWNGKTTHGEWIRQTAEIPLETYDQFVGKFNPTQFNAGEWVRMAKDAGMKYIVITSKHHDGFSIFDSKTSDFDIMSTPFKRDILKELADACRKEGIRLGFYHSIMDWHHPDYLPRRHWETDRSTEGADYDRYVKYMKAQLTELCQNYGTETPAVLWFDGEWESTWNNERGADLYNFVRNLKPDILINNRVGASRQGMGGFTAEGGVGGDFGTPEQEIPANGIPDVDWESCMTMNGNWGYNQADHNFKSSETLVRYLTDIASKGGNFLLNIGPKADGNFPTESVELLREMGSWMRLNSSSIYGTQASPFRELNWDGRVTMKTSDGNTRLFLHVFEQPKDGKLILHGVANEVLGASYLDPRNKNKINVSRQEDAVVVELTTPQPDLTNTVIVVDLKGQPDIHLSPTINMVNDIFVNNLAVKLLDETGGADIHYTLDGSVPTAKSMLYKAPLVVDKTVTITARSFRNGKAISGLFQKTLTKVVPKPAEPVTVVAPGLFYLYFEGLWDQLPDFDKMKAVKTGVVKNFDRSAKNKAGEQYGFEYRGFLNIPADGVYTFYTSSDDGSRLWLDRELVVDNDRTHGMTEMEGTVALAKGYHEIWVRYFEATGGDDLQVFWRSENFKKQPVPDEVLFYVQPK